MFLKEQKYGHGSQQDPKPRLIVLAKANSNLRDRPFGSCKTYNYEAAWMQII
jgi:hypothetical protein